MPRARCGRGQPDASARRLECRRRSRARRDGDPTRAASGTARQADAQRGHQALRPGRRLTQACAGPVQLPHVPPPSPRRARTGRRRSSGSAVTTQASRACPPVSDRTAGSWRRTTPRRGICPSQLTMNDRRNGSGLAEREGFEPSVEFPLHTLSKRAPSTTRTSLRMSGINSLPEGGEPCKSKLVT